MCWIESERREENGLVDPGVERRSVRRELAAAWLALRSEECAAEHALDRALDGLFADVRRLIRAEAGAHLELKPVREAGEIDVDADVVN